MGEPIPLSVWPTAQQTSKPQRTGRYVAPSMAHPAKMLPALARRAITAYTESGDVVGGSDVWDRHHPGRSRPPRPRRRRRVLDAFTGILAATRSALRPGGIVVVTARPWRRNGVLVDFPAAVVTAAEHAGLTLLERNVALLAGLNG